MSETNITYQPYIQLSYRILETLEEFKTIQDKKTNTLDDLETYKSLLAQNQELLEWFPTIKEESFSQLSYLKVDKSSQSIFQSLCGKLKNIKNTIQTGESHIDFIKKNCYSGNENIIENSKDLFHSVYNDLSINRGFEQKKNKLEKQVEKLESIVLQYEVEQERIRKEQERLKREEEERLRREEEERRRLAEEERLQREKRKKLILNILKWAGIIAGGGLILYLLIVFILIPVISWIIAHIWWIIIGIVVIAILIFRASS